MKIAPFGHRSILVVDLDAQYIDYYAALRRMVFEGESPFYSWSKMLGGSMLGIISYYLSSPFSIIPLLFPESSLPVSFFWMTLAKVGSCGLAMALYLKYSLKAKGLALVTFSTPYALMAYVGMYSYNIMWLNGLILLPLMALGIEKIVRGEAFHLYFAALTLMLIANYYIGYMMCIFAVLYFLYQAALCYRPGENMRIVRQAAVFGGSSLLAAGSAAFLLLPTYYTLTAGKLTFDRDLFGLLPQFHLLNLLPKLLIGAYDTAFGHLPNIYSGLAMALLAGLFFANQRVPVRSKTAAGVLLTILLLSFYWSGPDLIWHGLQIPKGFPYRYSFLFSFLIITLAYQGYQGINGLSRRSIFIAGALGAALVAIVKVRGVSYIPDLLLLASFALVCVYTAIFAITRQGFAKTGFRLHNYHTLILAGVVLFEAALNMGIYIRATHLEFKYRDRSSYQTYRDQMEQIVNKVKQSDPGFYRIEKTFFRTFNDAMNLDYRGISHFSSSVDRPMLVFLKQVGFFQAFYRMLYTGQTLPMDSILGVKYLLSVEPLQSAYVETGRDSVESDQIPGGEVITYQNPYALPLGFMVNPELAGLKINSYNPLYWQNQILHAMTGSSGKEFFTPIKVEAVETSNLRVEESPAGWLRYTKQDSGADAVIEYHLLLDSPGPIYGFLVAQDASKMEVSLGDRFLGYFGENSENNQVLLLGEYPPGSRLVVKAKLLYEQATLLKDILFYRLDTNRFLQAQQDLAANPLVISAFTDTTVVGRVNATGDKTLLFTSIPYDPAWSVLLDGQEAAAVPLMGAFLGMEIPPGEHEIRFEYRPRGWRAGWAVTAFSLVMAAAAFIWQRRRNR